MGADTAGGDEVAAVRERQRQWFGRPLNELLGDAAKTGGLTQAQLADRLGVSASMVSLLMSGAREKPGNPLVQERIAELGRTLDAFHAGDVSRSQVEAVLDASAAPSTIRSRTHTAAPSTAGTVEYARFLRNLLASVASAEELGKAARTLKGKHPELAELLLTCGTGRTSEAEAYLRRLGVG